MNKTNRRTKRTVAIVVAVLALFTTALGGTLAYVDYSQHKSNELNGGAIKYEGRLVEDFEKVDDWKVEDPAVKKEISVVNLGTAPEYGDVYVRIQLKEYMEIGSLTYNQTSKRYMIDTSGEFIVFTTEALAAAAYPGHNFASLTDVVTGKTGYFVETKAGDPNGQMGKYVITGYGVGNPKAVIPLPAPQQRAVSPDHQKCPNEECGYAVHSWKAGAPEDGIHEYVNWLLNTGAIIKLSEWLDPAGLNGAPVAKWVVDDTNDSGWIYWGQALQPGHETELFMKEVELVKQPDGNFYYVIHTDMQALSLDELSSGNKDWGDAGNSFIKNTPKLAWASAPASTVKVGATIASPGVVSTPNPEDAKGLTWSSSDPSIATVDADGKVTGVKEGGPVTITATNKNGTKVYYSIDVTPGAPATVPADSVTINDNDLTMKVGENHPVNFTVLPPGATSKPVWSSNNGAVATVDQNGKITAVGEGTATITVTVDGKSDTIKVTVSSDTRLPLVDDPKTGGYSPIKDENDARQGDGLLVKIDYDDPSVYKYTHDGAIHLEDVISDKNYNGVTAEAVDAKYKNFITIGTDHHGKPSILYSYEPTKEEHKAFIQAHGQDDAFVIQTAVKLTRNDGKSATITINMYYWESLLTYA